MSEAAPRRTEAALSRPRVGFLGVGWIGRHRMAAALSTGRIEAVGISDPSPEMAAAARQLAPEAACVDDLDALLELGVDGVVIATPSALHAQQSIAALRAGAAVFCQKPLGRTAAEARAVVAAAGAADRLLAVDFSYRFTEAMQRIRHLIRNGALGRVFAADMVFHNGYGPDKPWFYDPALSGGGCVMDLGVHLADLALWALDFPQVAKVSSALLAGGRALRPHQVEDYATATLELEDGAVVRVACSWRLHAGCDARISASFHGTEGGAEFRNLGGSFYDFVGERFSGVSRKVEVSAPDAWGGRAIMAWSRALADGAGFDPTAERLVDVADVLDRIYAASRAS